MSPLNRARIALQSGISWCYYAFRLPLSLRRGDPILVIQMGKVGSRTVVESLQRLPLGRPVYHIHHLSQRGLETDRRRTRARGMAPGGHYWVGRYLRDRLEGRDWQLITLVRDPVARNVSAFFHNLDLFHPEQKPDAKSVEPANLESIKTAFLERFPHEIPLHWLDEELKAFCGIDVYSTAFDPGKGYGLYGQDKKALLIRLEDLDSAGPEALALFLGLDQVELVRANVAGKKSYGRLYKEFLSKVRLPPEYLDYMYNSRFARHFYTQTEITALMRRWSRQDRCPD